MAKILFVEDEAYNYKGVIFSLESCHPGVICLTNGSDALRELRLNHSVYDLVILDLMLPPGYAEDPQDAIPDGLQPEEVGEYVYKRMQVLCPGKPTIILTGIRPNMGEMPRHERARLLQKPQPMADLLDNIDALLR